jgi:hypothetical protein
MIELRWVLDDSGFMQLQQRTRTTEWSEWKEVPIVHDPQALVPVDECGDKRFIHVTCVHPIITKVEAMTAEPPPPSLPQQEQPNPHA